jgi:hypothetical protein
MAIFNSHDSLPEGITTSRRDITGIVGMYLVPPVRREMRSQPSEMSHVMQDGVRSLVFSAENKYAVDEFLYTPAIKPGMEQRMGLAEGESYLRGFEVPLQPIYFLGMEMFQISIN